MTDLDELEQLARAATPGEWKYRHHPRLGGFVEAPMSRGMNYGLEVLGDDYTGYGDDEQKSADAQYIAAANPATLLVLLDRLRKAEAEREQLREDAEKWRRHIEELRRRNFILKNPRPVINIGGSHET